MSGISYAPEAIFALTTTMTPEISSLLLDKASLLAPQLVPLLEVERETSQRQNPLHHRNLRINGGNGENNGDTANDASDVCPGLERLLGIGDNIMNHYHYSDSTATTDEFLLCKCDQWQPHDSSSSNTINRNANQRNNVSITCLFPTVCSNYEDKAEEDSMECASLTLSFDFHVATSLLHAGACIDYSNDYLEEVCIGLDFSLLQPPSEQQQPSPVVPPLVLHKDCHATYGGNTCQTCRVENDTSTTTNTENSNHSPPSSFSLFCMEMDCSEWNQDAVTDGCQPLGIAPGHLDPSNFLPTFSHRANENDETTATTTTSSSIDDDERLEATTETTTTSGSITTADIRLALSNSVIFLFNLMRHYIL